MLEGSGQLLNENRKQTQGCRGTRHRLAQPIERPETSVTFRTGHIGYTFRLLQAGGVDAVESDMAERESVNSH
jgi:hypothetical protein